MRKLYPAVKGSMRTTARAPMALEKLWAVRMDGCPCHFRCVPPGFGLRPRVQPHCLASGPLGFVLQSVRGSAQTRALVLIERECCHTGLKPNALNG